MFNHFRFEHFGGVLVFLSLFAPKFEVPAKKQHLGIKGLVSYLVIVSHATKLAFERFLIVLLQHVLGKLFDAEARERDGQFLALGLLTPVRRVPRQ